MLQPELLTHSPFFGDQPEAVSLVQADLKGVSLRRVASALSEVLRYFARAEARAVRWQIGLGPTFFARFPGLARPCSLKPLRINGDDDFGLEWGGGETDLLVAVGGSWQSAVDAAAAVGAGIAAGFGAVRDIHVGYNAFTERDHSGFIDGTSNLQELTPAQFSSCVLVQPEDDQAFAGGSYMVFRKYEEDLEMWNDLPDSVQEFFVGRDKLTGRFLNGREMWTPSVWEKTSPCAHIRRANPREVPASHPDHWKERIYRRGLKFIEQRRDGDLTYGLLFIALVRDPEMQFARIHNERMLPTVGSKDHFLSSGYIKPLHSSCYYLPTPARLRELLKPSTGSHRKR